MWTPSVFFLALAALSAGNHFVSSQLLSPQMGLYSMDTVGSESGYSSSDIYLNPYELAQIIDAQKQEEQSAPPVSESGDESDEGGYSKGGAPEGYQGDQEGPGRPQEGYGGPQEGAGYGGAQEGAGYQEGGGGHDQGSEEYSHPNSAGDVPGRYQDQGPDGPPESAYRDGPPPDGNYGPPPNAHDGPPQGHHGGQQEDQHGPSNSGEDSGEGAPYGPPGGRPYQPSEKYDDSEERGQAPPNHGNRRPYDGNNHRNNHDQPQQNNYNTNNNNNNSPYQRPGALKPILLPKAQYSQPSAGYHGPEGLAASSPKQFLTVDYNRRDIPRPGPPQDQYNSYSINHNQNNFRPPFRVVSQEKA